MVKPYERKVQYYETDKMGIVHHSNYIRWFEEARTDYMEQLGAGYEEMEAEGVVSPVLEVSCKYKTMARFPERFQISVRMLEFNGIRMKLGYEVRDVASQEIRCTGETSHCFLNETYHPVSLKKSYPQWYERLIKAL
ncbi:MAG: acyl-CoA thioesterase [Ruminococcus sp.]|jgi:acyl-CoA thioester hydrolase